MRKRTIVVIVWIAVHAVSAKVYSVTAPLASGAVTAITPQQSADARVALDAMTLSLRAVRSGTCRMQCHFLYDPNDEGEGKHSDTEENVFIAFDKTQGLYRYDDLETRYSGRPNQIVVRPDMVIRTQADWKTSGSLESRGIIRQSPDEAKNIFKHHRDPFLTVLVDCRTNDIRQTHAGVLDRLLDKSLPDATLVSYEKVGLNLVRVLAHRHSVGLKATVEYDFTLNSSQGYVPVRVLVRHNATKSGEWTKPDVIGNEWIAANGVYVPERSHSTGTFSRNSELTFKMDWNHVNEPLDSALFSEEAFDPQRGDIVVIAKADQHVVEKIVGVELPKLPVKQADPPPRRWRFALFLLANALAFGGWLYFLRRRRLASRKS